MHKSGKLHGTHYTDKIEPTLKSGEYKYKVKAGGPGKLKFKVRYLHPKRLTEAGPDRWVTIVREKGIDAGCAESGTFTIPKVAVSTNNTLTSLQTRIRLTRKVLSKKVDWDMTVTKV